MNGPPKITETSLRAAADQAGLDWNRLRHDINAPAIQQHVDANLVLSKILGV